MDSLHICIALGPLAVYLLVIGSVNAARRPRVTTGARDLAALGLGILGLIVVGPMALFFPEDAAAELGGVWLVWLLLVALYGLGVLLVLLLMRPRLIIYNTSPDQLRPVLGRVVEALDDEAIWAADSLILPTLGIQFHLEPFGPMRSAQLVSSGPRQSHAGWRRLEQALAAELRETRSARNPFAFVLISSGLVMLAFVTLSVARDPQTIAQSLQEFLQ